MVHKAINPSIITTLLLVVLGEIVRCDLELVLYLFLWYPLDKGILDVIYIAR